MRPPKLSRIVLYGILFLFFFQLISDFIEATYAFGLLGGGFTVEAASVLLLLSPVVLLLVRNGLQGWPLVLVGELMLVSRVAEPMLGTRGRMLVAGLGVACFMILLPVLLSKQGDERPNTGGLTLGAGLTIGLSLSILFRALNSGIDISTYGWFQAIGWILAIIAGVLMFGFLTRGETPSSKSLAGDKTAPGAGAGQGQPGFWRTAGLSLGVASVMVLLYFAFTSPNVIARWTGASYLLIVSIIMLVLSVFAVLLASAPRLFAALTRRVMFVWNLLFVLSMVLTILGHQTGFPADAGAYPLSEPAGTLLHHVPLLLMLLLFPVILVDFTLLAHSLAESRPSSRSIGGAFTLASLFFLFMIFAQIFTTVYDYVPVAGPPFRDKFWLVFLIGGVALTLPVLLVRRSSFSLDQASSGWKIGPAFPGLISLISLATVVGAFMTAAKPAPPSGPVTTLRILTYNVQQGYNEDGLKNYDGQLDLIRKVDADVIGLQECDTNRVAGGNSDLVRFFADKLNLYSYYGPRTVAGTFGVALLSKYPIENPRTLYHYSEQEQEATIHAQISVGDRTFDVFNTHLASENPVENRGQLRELLAEVRGRENVILIGDLNFAPDTPEGQYGLTAEVLDDSWVLKWPQVDKQGADPTGEGVDHVFVSPGTKVADAQYVPGSESESDHAAMTTDIEW